MPNLINISRPLSSSTAPWPGDTPFDFGLSVRRQAGSGINVGAFSASTHFGTHLDAPFHFTDSTETIDQLDLGVCYGDALVADVRGHSLIGPELLPDTMPRRVLLRTDSWVSSTEFPVSIPTLSLEAVRKLAAQSVALVGVDVPSVDQLDSKDLPIHHALYRAGITILESLFLVAVTPGSYLLAAFPLLISGGDAAPARAVLIEQPQSGSGNNIVFDFSVQDNKIHYEGTVNSTGDQTEGTCDYGGQASGTFKGTKASNK
jgi:arylformamidase